MFRRLILLLISFVLALTACAPPAQPTVTPMPPSATPRSEVISTQGPTATPVERATLPPTWTFVPTQPTATPTLFTPVYDPTNETLKAQPTLAACATFVEDRERTVRLFESYAPVTVYWGAAQGAVQYRVTLYDINYVAVVSQITRDTEYTFPAELFTPGAIYGWEVRPYDGLGNQFCLPIGNDLSSY
jgi:hypothetical protein